MHVLLRAGARVGVVDHGGRTALHWAARLERSECLRLAISHAENDVVNVQVCVSGSSRDNTVCLALCLGMDVRIYSLACHQRILFTSSPSSFATMVRLSSLSSMRVFLLLYVRSPSTCD